MGKVLIIVLVLFIFLCIFFDDVMDIYDGLRELFRK